MEAAKQMRAKQLERFEAFVAGNEVNFENHQYKEFKAKYDPSVYEKPRTPFKIQFENKALFLSAAYEEDVETIERLAKEGVDVNVSNAEGLTALHTVREAAIMPQISVETRFHVGRLVGWKDMSGPLTTNEAICFMR
eukprot:TRINITY_DN11587_c0_g3_i7.p2 TRINITY_DN11587_c0_g3~~TRINITY_DN11587_c0_g3_i7.p2  ORF type:complete len:137 (+),score=26.02 TRINITY_DN11587_c0_g3_i7:169-579(+)